MCSHFKQRHNYIICRNLLSYKTYCLPIHQRAIRGSGVVVITCTLLVNMTAATINGQKAANRGNFFFTNIPLVQSWPWKLVSLLSESMWGDIQGSVQHLTDCYEFPPEAATVIYGDVGHGNAPFEGSFLWTSKSMTARLTLPRILILVHSLESWIHRIVISCPLGCVTESV